MGCSPFNKSCSVYSPTAKRTVGNPNPARFEILRVEEVGPNLVAMIRYPDCKNYEGVKVLLYRSMSKQSLMSAKRLDPHFSEWGASPIARFQPDAEGWLLALSVAVGVV